ncbi:MAG: hypothetical protein ACRCXT_17435 [Paraclostridium sp.]
MVILESMIRSMMIAEKLQLYFAVKMKNPHVSKPEIIINDHHNINDLIKYYKEFHNSDGTLKVNNEYKILGYTFGSDITSIMKELLYEPKPVITKNHKLYTILSLERIEHPNWDMSISLKELFEYNDKCIVECSGRYAVQPRLYLSHPEKNDKFCICLILLENGFWYYSDGRPLYDNTRVIDLIEGINICIQKRKEDEERS